MVKVTPRPRRPLPERPVLVQNGELVLEGLYIKKTSENLPVVLSAPHPQFGGSMDSPVINELAYALARAEVASLRYNYRGIGASQGTWSEGVGEQTDLAAAIEVLLETYYGDNPDKGDAESGELALVGYSFGSWLSFRHAKKDKRVQRLLLVAPPLGKDNYDYSTLGELKMQIGILVGSKDTFCPLEALDAFLADFKKRYPKSRPPEVQVIPEASHYFVRGLSAAGEAAARFVTTGHFAAPTGEIDLGGE